MKKKITRSRNKKPNKKPTQRKDRREGKECIHRRIKKNYNFGRKSTPQMFCKNCGKIITPHLLYKQRSRK